jgi:hypothetical protein
MYYTPEVYGTLRRDAKGQNWSKEIFDAPGCIPVQVAAVVDMFTARSS